MRTFSLSKLAEFELSKQQQESVYGGFDGDSKYDMCKSCFCLEGSDPNAEIAQIAQSSSK